MKLVIKNKNYTKGEIIKILREWTGKTQKEFGKDIHRGENTIQKYESDTINYSMEVLLDILKENGITVTFEKK